MVVHCMKCTAWQWWLMSSYFCISLDRYCCRFLETVTCLLQFQANEALMSEIDNLKKECQRLLEERQLNQSQVCLISWLITIINTCYDSCSFIGPSWWYFLNLNGHWVAFPNVVCSLTFGFYQILAILLWNLIGEIAWWSLTTCIPKNSKFSSRMEFSSNVVCCQVFNWSSLHQILVKCLWA